MAKKGCVNFCKNHVGPILCHLVVFVVFTTLLFYFSIWCTFNYSSGDYSWKKATFNWTYDVRESGFLPMDLKYENYTILLDGHSHTTYSDGSISPEQNIQWHIANGYNAMILSDHNDVQGGTIARQIAREKYDDQIKVIVAQEYSCCRIHMNLVFPPSANVTAPLPSVAWPNDTEIQSVVAQVHSLGGFVSVNHIPWSAHALHEQFSIQDLHSWGVDFVEIINQDTLDLQSYYYAMSVGMGIISGTDMHHPGSVNGWTTLLSNFTEDAIFESLMNRSTSLIYTAVPTPYSGSPVGTSKNLALDPFFRMGTFLKGYYKWNEPIWSFNNSFCGPTSLTLYWSQICVFLGWLFGGFFSFEIFGRLAVYGWGKFVARCCSKCKCCRKGEDSEIDMPERVPMLRFDPMMD